jgi:hypothetical protein
MICVAQIQSRYSIVTAAKSLNEGWMNNHYVAFVDRGAVWLSGAVSPSPWAIIEKARKTRNPGHVFTA